jgi:hypothetical protein
MSGVTGGFARNGPVLNDPVGSGGSTHFDWQADGDYFQSDAANLSWMENIHKDSAAFTFMLWFRANQSLAGLADPRRLLATLGDISSDTGFELYITNGGLGGSLNFGVYNAGTLVCGIGDNNDGVMAAGTWYCLGLSVDEATNAAIWRRNDDSDAESATVTYTSPSTGSATGRMRIGVGTDDSFGLYDGDDVAIVAAWSRALTAAEMNDFFVGTRGRFGV